ncbi:hemerythrin-like metal-binding protein [Magnetococcus marinus MC-1]|uniref:Hemerythrin-like metal-binding protein n=1 Tax=Magnetococcus marinus (strain ATCC BAA-1437 / JCM 17883 / MC-1) TaxID=156889 RepID=A0LCA6_MAGMM|nr:hemerythrin domain-containing protein [Magnetococcus marinus]ABK45599.1 hemerythrin-like metal-binding protein [Magnetococcus marinus MC-1]
MSALLVPCKAGPLTFEQNLKLNIPAIDQQHEQLFRLAIGINETLQSGATEDAVRMNALELEAYVQEHLVYEEKLLSSNHYPQQKSHRLAHARFVATSHKIQDELARCSGPACIAKAPQLFDLLTTWLCDHIMNVDRLAVDFMVPRANAPTPRNARFQISGRALIEFQPGIGITGRLENVGHSGLFLHIPPPLPEWVKPNAAAKIRLLPLDQTVGRTCTVVRIDPRQGIALSLPDGLSVDHIFKLVKHTSHSSR